MTRKLINHFASAMILGLGYTAQAFAVTSPSSVMMKIYSAYLSENGDCSGAIRIGGDGSYRNMISAPTLASGSIPRRVYKCLIMEMSDQVKVTPSANDGATCTSGTEYTFDVCRAGSTSTALNGDITPCNGTTSVPADDRVFVYISIFATGAAGSANTFAPPTGNGDTGHGVQLQSLIDVSSGSGTFIFDARDKIDGSGGSCEMNIPLFGYRQG